MNIEKALVVDDSKVAHLTLRKLLTERNIEVDWVGSGEDAIAYMERQQPDIIFMDVMMPGMDGFETANAITQNPAMKQAPIIMCSANATDEDKETAKKCGAIDFLSKPYTPAEMDQVLDMVREMPAPAIEEAEPTPAVEEAEPASTAEQAATEKAPEPPPEEAEPTPAVEEAEPAPTAEQAVTEKAPEPPPEEAPAAPEPTLNIENAADIERIAERAAWSIADKVARDVASEMARDKAEQMARTIAEQTARSTAEQVAQKLAEETTRKAVQAAVKAAQESAAGSGSEEIEHSARDAAEETARSLVEQMGRKINDDVTRKLEVNRDNLAKSLEEHVPNYVRDAITRAMTGQEFKQKINKTMADSVLPRAESSARQAALEASQDVINTMESTRKQAGTALIVGIVALLVALGAMALPFLYP